MINKIHLYACRLTLLFALALFSSSCSNLRVGIGPVQVKLPQANESIEDRIDRISRKSSVAKMTTEPGFEASYEMFLYQPLDHKDPNSATYEQRIIFHHRGDNKNCVIDLQGYQVFSNKATELTQLLDANQITIEHRFFYPSAPDSIPWEYLTTWQAAADQHRIIAEFKKNVYPNAKFISTGISKGGQCTMIHRSLYPDDVDASVAYVAPLNFAREDERIYEFLDTVGTDEENQMILDFQLNCFKRKDELTIELEKLKTEKGYVWYFDTPTALDYYILEYSFAFWQWGSMDFEDIPAFDADPAMILKHVLDVSGVSFFEKKGVDELQPFFWAALTEIGMYGYETEVFSEYLGTSEPYLFDFTTPEGTDPKYDSKRVSEVQEYLDTEATNMMFIYGALDTWGATRVVLSDESLNRGNKVYLLSDGHHGTRIISFPESIKSEIYSDLQKWMGQKLVLPK